MNKLSDKILATIAEQHIEPRPKWLFLIQDICVWLLLLTSVLFGALALAVLVYAISETDFSFLAHFGRSWAETLLFLTPIFWLFSFSLFLIVVFFFWKKTRRGYRIPMLYVVVLNLLVTGVLGIIIFVSGGGRAIEQSFERHFPLYHNIHGQRLDLWSRPKSGFLAGEILQTTEGSIQLKDFESITWQVDITKAITLPDGNYVIGDLVRMQGSVLDDGRFNATRIMKWRGRGREGGMRRPKNGLKGPGMPPELRPSQEPMMHNLESGR